jgi:hypothetical protein
MSLRALVGTIAIAVGLAPVLTGCGSGSGDADDVPTITTRPSTSASSTAPTDVTTASTETTEESSTSATETTTPSPTETTVAPPTSAAPPDQPNGPTTYRDAIDRVNSIATQGETVSTTRFATPGDDVYCLLDDPVIGPACELGNGFITDADVCGAGSSDRVGRIETIDDHPRPVCNTDTIREPGAKVISPDAAVVSGDVSCGVEPFGVTCIDRVAGVGFFLGKGEYHVFFRAD